MKIWLLFLSLVLTACTVSDTVSDTLTIPVNVYIIKSSDQELSSHRTSEEIERIFRDVNTVWNQAKISFEIAEIHEVTIDNNNLFQTNTLLLKELELTENYDSKMLNAYFVRDIHGPNGIAYPEKRFMIADITSVYDYRVTSHEIGHLLGLNHVIPKNRLMASGVNGFNLIDTEILTVQQAALALQ